VAFEPVCVVWDWYDGIRSGIAEFLGKPHVFHCEWDESSDDYAETFV
jgi:hypothetical protein